MKKFLFRRIVCTVMAVVFALSCNVFASNATPSTSENVLLQAAQGIIQAQRPYYNIEKVSVLNPVRIEKDGGGYWIEYMLELTMRLKYNHATELPQIRGLAAGFDIDSAKLTTEEFVSVMKSADIVAATAEAASAEAIKAVRSMDIDGVSTISGGDLMSNEAIVAATIADIATSDVVRFVEEIEAESIGVSNVFNYGLRAEFDKNGNLIAVNYELAEGYTDDISCVIPRAEQEMVALGQQQATDIVVFAAEAVSKTNKATNTAKSNTQFTYKKISARDYANQYTSTASTHVCEGSYTGHNTDNAGIKQNKAYYNSNYRHYCGVDCANYASQVMFAGGVPTSSIWKAYTTAWIGGTSMKNYFYNNGNGTWSRTNFANAAAGEFIQMIDAANKSQHTMIIVLNDTVNHNYSAHTTDRKQKTFTSDAAFTTSSNWCVAVEYYRFDNFSMT